MSISSLKSYSALLKTKGIKPSFQRVKIMEFLTGGADPVSCAMEDSAHAAKDPPPAAPTGEAATRQRYELFQSFSHDVWCKDEPLSLLYQVLPYDIEPMSVLVDGCRAVSQIVP